MWKGPILFCSSNYLAEAALSPLTCGIMHIHPDMYIDMTHILVLSFSEVKGDFRLLSELCNLPKHLTLLLTVQSLS